MKVKIPKAKADALYVCLESYGFHDQDGATQAVQRGVRLRGDNALVRRHATYFAPADTPDDELQRLRVERGLSY